MRHTELTILIFFRAASPPVSYGTRLDTTN